MRTGQGVVIAGTVFLAGVLGYTAYSLTARQTDAAVAQCGTGTIVGGSIGGPLALQDSKGQPRTEQDILAKPALVYFGYANCPDICPVDNARNVEAADALAKQGLEVTPVFISVDPTRDTPEVLAGYEDALSVLRLFSGPSQLPRLDAGYSVSHRYLRAYSGSEEQVQAAAKAYKVFYQVPADKSPGYAVDHTTMTYLMLPGRGFADVFQRETTAEEIAATTACYLQAS